MQNRTNRKRKLRKESNGDIGDAIFPKSIKDQDHSVLNRKKNNQVHDISLIPSEKRSKIFSLLSDQNVIHFQIENYGTDNSARNNYTVPKSNSIISIFYHSSRTGIASAGAMYVNIFALMWLYTIIAYQNVKGCTSYKAVRTLYSEGGIYRFYRGLIPAMIIGPLSRFGDTFANHMVINTVDECLQCGEDIPLLFKTLPASVISALYRLLLFPIDTLLSINQVRGCSFGAGIGGVVEKFKTSGLGGIYNGAGVYFTGHLLSHWTWFTTFNYLNSMFDPKSLSYNSLQKSNTYFPSVYTNAYDTDEISVSPHQRCYFCMRKGLFGLCASVASDCFCNILYVIKTNKQLSLQIISNSEVITRTGGLTKALGRGLPLRIIGSGLQGFVFTASWSFLQSHWNNSK